MNKSALILCFLILALCSRAQQIYPISGTSPGDTDFSDFRSFEGLTGHASLIGFGEGTHGTHEFHTLRHRYFKYLVLEKNFNTFFLEADYGICIGINRFLQHGQDTSKVDSLVHTLRLWPWRTEELKALLLWMHDYNRDKNTVEKIQFVGCDMQFLKSNFIELKEIFNKYQINWPEDNFIDYGQMDNYSTGFQSYGKSKKDSVNILVDEIVKKLENQQLNRQDSFLARQLVATLKQRIRNDSGDRNYRDSCMAVNIISYLNYNKKSKGMYWAHNGHVSNDSNIFFLRKTAGYFLKNELEKNYFIIGTDFYRGKFTAVIKKGKKYVIGVAKASRPPRGTFSHKFKNRKLPNFLVLTDEIDKKLTVSSIGAAYGMYKTGEQYHRYTGYITAGSFDAMIYIRKSTPTRALK